MSDALKARFSGCLLGLALGDALGAPLEGGPIERLLWRLIGHTRAGQMRWTDDTQMSLDLAASLIAHGGLDCDDAARRFAGSYRWSRGYGPGAAKLLKRIAAGAPWQQANRSVYPNGSYGNGGAMRAPVIGLFFAADSEAVQANARDSARITHAHPLGLEGAVLIATAVAAALTTQDGARVFDAAAGHCREDAFRQRLATARQWLESGPAPSGREVRKALGNGIAAADSCVTALYIGCRFLEQPFADLLAFVAACSGDTDTIGAMAGAIWGAANGDHALPQQQLERLEAYAHLRTTAEALWRAADNS